MAVLHEFAGVDFEGQRVAVKMAYVVAVVAREGDERVFVGLGPQTATLKISYEDFMAEWRKSGYI